MLRKQMRKAMLEGKSFEDFVDEYNGFYSIDVLRDVWKNTEKVLDDKKWNDWLKHTSRNCARNMRLLVRTLQEEGIDVTKTGAGQEHKKAYEMAFGVTD